MKKLFLIFTLSTGLFAVENLGINGNLYDISEPNIIKSMTEEMEKNKKDYTEDYKKAVLEASVYNTTLTTCKEDKTMQHKDYFLIPENIYSPSGRLWKKKGEKMVVPQIPQPLNICYVDGSNLVSLKNQIDFMQEKTASSGGCIYLIANKSVLDLYNRFPNVDIYPSAYGFEQRFNLDCYPTIIHLVKDDVYTAEFNIEEFNHKKEVN